MSCPCKAKARAPKWQKPADKSKVAPQPKEEKTPQGEETK